MKHKFILLLISAMLLMACNDSATGAAPGARKPTVSPPAPDQPPVGMELEGMFRYFADAALFEDCRNGIRYPVSMERQYAELEKAYLNSGIEPGGDVYIKLRGRLLERESMEGNRNVIKLIVDELKVIDPEKTCAPTVHAELRNTYWKLTDLNGEPVTTPEGQKEAHLILAAEENRAHGHAGCNNFFGSYEHDETSLTFSPLGATMMACPQAMDTEQAFLAALGATTRYEIEGEVLNLYTDDQSLARLEAVYLP